MRSDREAYRVVRESLDTDSPEPLPPSDEIRAALRYAVQKGDEEVAAFTRGLLEARSEK